MGVPPDVAVVNVVMLSATWYARPVLARHALRYDNSRAADSTVSAAQRIVAWMRRESVAGGLGRPVAFALTAPIDTTSRESALQLAGPHWLVVPAGVATTDPTKIAQSLRKAAAGGAMGRSAAPATIWRGRRRIDVALGCGASPRSVRGRHAALPSTYSGGASHRSRRSRPPLPAAGARAPPRARAAL